jgi:hypothetical protein
MQDTHVYSPLQGTYPEHPNTPSLAYLATEIDHNSKAPSGRKSGGGGGWRRKKDLIKARKRKEGMKKVEGGIKKHYGVVWGRTTKISCRT